MLEAEPAIGLSTFDRLTICFYQPRAVEHFLHGRSEEAANTGVAFFNPRD